MKFLEKHKLGLIIVGIVLAVCLFFVSFLAGSYNNIISLEEQVNESYSNIEVQEKRRADLIPNFVDSVQDYKNFEKETLQQITEARSQAQSGNVDQAEKTINMVVEKYPDLKSSELYKNLQIELSTTENLIKDYREDYNKQVKSYIKKTRSFPTNIILGIMGYETEDFQYTEFNASENAPTNLFE